MTLISFHIKTNECFLGLWAGQKWTLALIYYQYIVFGVFCLVFVVWFCCSLMWTVYPYILTLYHKKTFRFTLITWYFFYRIIIFIEIVISWANLKTENVNAPINMQDHGCAASWHTIILLPDNSKNSLCVYCFLMYGEFFQSFLNFSLNVMTITTSASMFSIECYWM